MPHRRRIPPKVRQRIADLAGHRCSYCRSPEVVGTPMNDPLIIRPWLKATG